MKNILRLLVSGFVASFCAQAAHAAEPAALPAGAYSAGTIKGDVTYKLPGTTTYVKLEPGTALPQGVTIKTGEKSSAMVVFGSGSTAAIPAKSTIEVTKFEQAVFTGPVPVNGEPAVSNTELKVIDGSVTSKVAKLKKGSSFTVKSPVGAAGVRGTTFHVAFNLSTGQFSIATLEGRVVFNTPDGSVSQSVNAGSQLSGQASASTLAAAQTQAAVADGQAPATTQATEQGSAGTSQGTTTTEQGTTAGQGAQGTATEAPAGPVFEAAPVVAVLDTATFQAIVNAVSAVLPGIETIAPPAPSTGEAGQTGGTETSGQTTEGTTTTEQSTTGTTQGTATSEQSATGTTQGTTTTEQSATAGQGTATAGQGTATAGQGTANAGQGNNAGQGTTGAQGGAAGGSTPPPPPPRPIFVPTPVDTSVINPVSPN